jgi:hypothetical protein
LYRHERAGGGRPPRELHGVYAQLSMFVWRGLGVAARGGFADVPDGVVLGALDNPGFGLPIVPLSRSYEAGGLVTYHLFDGLLRAQLAYQFRRDLPRDPLALSTDKHLVEVQLQASF